MQSSRLLMRGIELEGSGAAIGEKLGLIESVCARQMRDRILVSVPVSVAIKVCVAVSGVCKGPGSAVQERRGDNVRASERASYWRWTTAASTLHRSKASAGSSSSVGVGGGIGTGVSNVGRVGTGDEGIAEGVADDVVVTVLVGREDDELDNTDKPGMLYCASLTSVPRVRLTGMSRPKTPQGWSVKGRVLGLPSASRRTRGARLPVTRIKFSWDTTST